jgi:hypothetical protein
MNWDFLMVVTVQKELLTLTDFQIVVMTVQKVSLIEIQEPSSLEYLLRPEVLSW